MRWDPDAREAKYAALRKVLNGNGFTTNVNVEWNRVDSMSIRHSASNSFVFCVAARDRGWYIHLPRAGIGSQRIYRISDPVLIPALLSRFIVERGNTENLTETIETEYQLEAVSYAVWSKDEWGEQKVCWRGFGWRELSDAEYQSVKSKLRQRDDRDKLLQTLSPCVTWDLRGLLERSSEFRDDLESAITMHSLRSFQAVVPKDKEVYVLDWQHPCYGLNVHKGIQRAMRDEWAREIISFYDDVEFVSQDFDFGLTCSRNSRFRIFGGSFIEAFVRDMPADLMSIDAN